MKYININTLAQYTESEIRGIFPNTSFVQPFVPADVYQYVFPTPQPTYNSISQYVQEIAATYINGHWEQQWEVVELDTPTTEANLAALRTAKNTAIKAERDRRKFNGVYVSDKWIHTDADSRTQWLGMVMMGASIPIIDWTTMDNTTIMTSQTLANEVFQATATLDATLFAYAKSLIAAVNASSDPASIDITIGWPDTYAV